MSENNESTNRTSAVNAIFELLASDNRPRWLFNFARRGAEAQRFAIVMLSMGVTEEHLAAIEQLYDRFMEDARTTPYTAAELYEVTIRLARAHMEAIAASRHRQGLETAYPDAPMLGGDRSEAPNDAGAS